MRGTFGDLELALHPGPLDAITRDASARELRWLIYEFKYGAPEARRILREIHRELGGLRPADPGPSTGDLAFGSPLAEALGEDLLHAAYSGRLLVRARKPTPPIAIADVEGDEVLGPESEKEEQPPEKAWIRILLQDQDGAPVPNRRYRVVAPDGAVSDGQLDSHGAATINDLTPGTCQIWCPYVEPQDASTYTVADGDHASGVADTFGFDDYTQLWNDPGNADLAGARPDPHVLLPGDAIAVPAIPAKPATTKSTGAQYPFAITRSPLKLRLELLDLSLKPLAQAPVVVAGTALSTDGNGVVEAPLDKPARHVAVTLPSGDVDVMPGALNPIDEAEAGWKARLFNMGFLWDPEAEEGEDEMAMALEDFQASCGVAVTRTFDDATKAQLALQYGC